MLEVIGIVFYAMVDNLKLCRSITAFGFWFVFVLPFGLIVLTVCGVLAVFELIIEGVTGS
jgi:hypothetical protein